MKRFLATICMLFFAVTVLCACDNSFTQKSTISGDDFNTPTINLYQSQTIPNKTDTTFTVYICGAVQNEGYYVVAQGSTVADAISLAGILTQTIFPTNSQSFVKTNCQIVVRYYENGTNFDCINVNGAYVQHNLPTPNVPASVIAKLNAYYVQNGAITNKQILQQILTEQEYQQNHYKFFVQESDYEKAD